jgi:CBS domain-containing protein
MNRTTAYPIETPLMLRAQTAADLMMPNPISIRAEAGVADAITLFTEKRIDAAPVIDEAGRPIGVVSRSDLLVHQCEHDKKRAGAPDYFFAPVFKSNDLGGDASLDIRSTVADVMTPAIFAVSPDTPVNRVVSDMVGLHVHRLFVVDMDGILVGVISTMDVLKHLRPEE